MSWFKFNKDNKAKPAATMAAVLLLAVPFVGQAEGLRLKSYLDAVGIPTICYGETDGVRLGQIKTRQECDNMLAVRLAYFAKQVDNAIVPPMTNEMHAALASWTYNVGVGAMQKSTLVKKINALDYKGGCDQLLKWTQGTLKGKKVVLPGLVARRQKERELCMKGLI